MDEQKSSNLNTGLEEKIQLNPEKSAEQDRIRRVWTNATVVALIAILCNCLWGSAIPAIKVGYRYFAITDSVSTKFLFAGIRFLLAGLMVLVIYCIMHKKLPILHRDEIMPVCALALVQTTIQYIFFYIGVANCASANGSIVNACTTFVSVILAHFIYKDDKLNGNKILGCLIGFAGVLMVTIGSGSEASTSVSFFGEGFVVIAALAFSVSGVMSKQITKKVDSILTTGYNLSIGGLVLIVIGMAEGGHFEQVNTPGILVLLYLALLSAVAFALWTILLKYNKIGKICIYNFVVPVSGIFLAGLILHEDIWHLKYYAAMILVSIGIVIVNRRKEKEKEKAQ